MKNIMTIPECQDCRIVLPTEVQSEYFLQLAVEKKRDYGRILSAVMGLYAAGFHLIPCFSPPHPYIVAIAIVPLTYYCIAFHNRASTQEKVPTLVV